ncbi:hypothetical protein BDN72DRAFT_850569 [Pluteus cervinus]|uniref:Uncharacterized protein n=1 Tax=Pluteus cervinus TaxID=181527 RepID=A0ACD3A4B5_9AGAR|nr:hypothetical protein BDN72DRAFT_850569 [Pluteus cervinus]
MPWYLQLVLSAVRSLAGDVLHCHSTDLVIVIVRRPHIHQTGGSFQEDLAFLCTIFRHALPDPELWALLTPRFLPLFIQPTPNHTITDSLFRPFSGRKAGGNFLVIASSRFTFKLGKTRKILRCATSSVTSFPTTKDIALVRGSLLRSMPDRLSRQQVG